jgi:hypothetical protein
MRRLLLISLAEGISAAITTLHPLKKASNTGNPKLSLKDGNKKTL